MPGIGPRGTAGCGSATGVVHGARVLTNSASGAGAVPITSARGAWCGRGAGAATTGAGERAGVDE